MSVLRGPWDAPHHPARSWLLFRGLYALLAFDAWMLMIEHGGRYGVGPFNVAHFDLVEQLVPMPGPRLYVALVTAAGLYALVGALGLLSRLEAALLCALYTFAWMLSMHDSYQHHYLLSWLLAFGICVRIPSVRVCARADTRVRDPALTLVALACAIVYAFTAVSKSSPLWRRGVVLQKLARGGGPMAWGPNALVELGWSGADAFRLAAFSVALVQVIIAAGFLASVARDARQSRSIALLCGGALSCAAAFHIATELSPFAIGWFSYYMLWTGTVVLLPARWLAPLLTPFARMKQRMTWPRPSPRGVWGACALSFAVCAAFALREDLPGVADAVLLFSCSLAVRAYLASRAGHRRRALRYALTPALATSLLAAALSLAQVRFDYFRRAAGELMRMGRAREALDLYKRAERHAPPGQSRRDKIRELERDLASEPNGERAPAGEPRGARRDE